MNRRKFLKVTAATAVTGPILLGAQDKAGSKLPRVGTGEHAYECHHNWGELPTGFEWQTTHNVAVDSQGLVYVTHQAVGKGQLDTVVVFDPAGKYVRSFGKKWHAGGHGIDIRKEGGEEFAYLANMTSGGPVVKCSLTGEVVWEKGAPAESEKYEPRPGGKDPKKSVTPPYRPTNVAFLPDGGFYVGDGYGSHYMHRYDRDGKWVKTFGGMGTEDGKFRTPHGQWVDTRGEKPVLVVCDRANARLQTFTPDGEYISQTAKGTVLFPAHIDIRGDVMMVPDLHTRVSLFGKDNRLIAHLGEDDAWRERVVGSLGKKGVTPVRNQPKEWAPGKFVHPHDACFDRDGNIYVAEWVATGRITFLKKVG
jgi:DNA-binding beta-propeller fold protein YncE